MLLSIKFLFPFPTYIVWFGFFFKLLENGRLKNMGFLPYKEFKPLSTPTLLAYWYMTAWVIYAFISLVLYFKDFWFILEIPMPSASFLEETSDKEHTPLWIPLNIQVCMFVVLCWNMMFFLGKELLTSTIN